jgi:saccharopine dehydrogenase-like NADP-dependent oxidoreductase
MAGERIVILGGYGNTGKAVARLLLEHSTTDLVLAGRDPAKASRAAEDLNRAFGTSRVRGAEADASRAESLRPVLHGASIVVAASSTSAHAAVVGRAALDAGADYMDPQYSTRKLDVLRGLEASIETAGRCFVTDAGFHPGLPAVLVRYAAGRLPSIRRARVASVIQVNWKELEFSPATLEEMASEFADYQSLHYRDGRWRSMGWFESFVPLWVQFGHGFGRRYTMPMFLEEMRPLPSMFPSLKETGFFVGGFNPVVDFVLMPLGMGLMKVAPRRGAAMFGGMLEWGLRQFTRPPYGTLLQLEAEGEREGRPAALTIEVAHSDGYLLTAAPMVACLLQMLDGSARKPGLHLQALLVEPARLLDDLKTMGVDVLVHDGM